MLSLTTTLLDNLDVIKAAVVELNHYEDIVGEKELKFLLFDTYDAIYPEFDKKNTSPARFVLECLRYKDELLSELNRAFRLKVISVI